MKETRQSNQHAINLSPVSNLQTSLYLYKNNQKDCSQVSTSNWLFMLPSISTGVVPKVRIEPGTPLEGGRPLSAFYYTSDAADTVTTENSDKKTSGGSVDASSRCVQKRRSRSADSSASSHCRLGFKEPRYTLPPISRNSSSRRPSTTFGNDKSDSPTSSSLMSFIRLGVSASDASAKASPMTIGSLSSASSVRKASDPSNGNSENVLPFEEHSGIPKELAKIKRHQLIGATGDTLWIDSVSPQQILSPRSLEVKTGQVMFSASSKTSCNSQLTLNGSKFPVKKSEAAHHNSIIDTQTTLTAAGFLGQSGPALSFPSGSTLFPPLLSGHNGSLNYFQCRWNSCNALCFQTVDMLTRHVVNDHIVIDQQQFSLPGSDTSRRRTFVCRWAECNRKGIPFQARYKLVNHLRTHTGEKPAKCVFPACEKAFTSSESLKIHLTSHTGERPYPCDSCDKTFSNRSDRSRHRRTHVAQRPFVCNYPGCNKNYTDPSSLRKHLKSHNSNITQSSTESAQNGAVSTTFTQRGVKSRAGLVQCLTVQSLQQTTGVETAQLSGLVPTSTSGVASLPVLPHVNTKAIAFSPPIVASTPATIFVHPVAATFTY